MSELGTVFFSILCDTFLFKYFHCFFTLKNFFMHYLYDFFALFFTMAFEDAAFYVQNRTTYKVVETNFLKPSAKLYAKYMRR